jgi:ATP-dependent DNA helicase DinG
MFGLVPVAKDDEMTVLSVCIGEEDFNGIGWCDLPRALRVKRALREGLRAGVVPASKSDDSDVDFLVKLQLSGSDEQQLQRLAVDQTEFPSMEDKAGGVIRAFVRNQSSKDRTDSGEHLIVKPRREQSAMCRLMADSAERSGILFMEASTGVGKGRALCAHAAYLVNEELASRVLVAAPTIAVLNQLYLEYASLTDDRPDSAVMIGMQEFVSEQALRQLLDDPASDELPGAAEATHWLEDAANEPWGALGKRWLCASLEQAAPDFPIDQVRLLPHLRAIYSEEDDRGILAYEGCSRIADKVQLVFCTHAKVAHDVVRRLIATRDQGIPSDERADWDSEVAWWHADLEQRSELSVDSLLPDYDALLVDEAHLLERSFDAATSDRISVFSLKLLVDQHGPQGLRCIVDQAFKTLTAVGKQTESVRVGAETRDAHQVSACLKSVLRGIKRHHKSITNKSARIAIQDFARRLSWLEWRGDVTKHFMTHVFFSPSRRYPLIERSKRSVNRELTFLWKGVESAVLASATLYLPTERGLLMNDIRKELRVPVDRANSMTPICPKWVTDPVHLFVPPGSASSDDTSSLLLPPKFDASADDWSRYFDRMAAFFVDTFESRHRGGTLVLMTSFAGIDELATRLLDSSLADRVIAYRRGSSFEQCKRLYLERVTSGDAPIWLATGRAWTGLDLSLSGPAKHDHAIDSLVIPRLPVMMNSSNVYRQYLLNSPEGRGFGNREVWTCGQYLRQGMGRLVRRRGVPDKELFILDGRLCRAVRSPMNRLRAVLSNYENVNELTIPF